MSMCQCTCCTNAIRNVMDLRENVNATKITKVKIAAPTALTNALAMARAVRKCARSTSPKKTFLPRYSTISTNKLNYLSKRSTAPWSAMQTTCAAFLAAGNKSKSSVARRVSTSNARRPKVSM